MHSDSWGGDPEGEYTSDAIGIDLFVWEHPSFLNVRAAGNTGAGAYGTVVTQACAKNAIAVGASGNARLAYADYSLYTDYEELLPLYVDALCPINSSYWCVHPSVCIL